MDDHILELEYLMGQELYQYVEKKKQIERIRSQTYFKTNAYGSQVHSLNERSARDIKLENCMILDDNTIKWIDFGLAHIFVRYPHEYITSVCGSRSYCAPEVLARTRYTGFSSDMWSMGVCLFAMTHGYFPYEIAEASDWRFANMLKLLPQHSSTVHNVWSFYQFSGAISDE